jgi:hypothetical protein
LAGAAALVGERNAPQVQFSWVGPPPHTTTQAFSDTPAVFIVDGQAGLSYWFSPNLKITASNRVDAYFNVLKTTKTGTANSSFTSVDQIYNGPMLRLTSSF